MTSNIQLESIGYQVVILYVTLLYNYTIPFKNKHFKRRFSSHRILSGSMEWTWSLKYEIR
ncbi:predicted protein [Histoplasma mississippiense (nom. inval.)]|uniref:predicted protein n=1 Tax=Ajellomyces capsulatus (strain NAm1 / WU24) TaxID=2059318 RepID=UPI000157D477|nr:predicted protein [Histoplasma mississippiense (nom. inval.)]EDN07507.1 predicted protein [Histoplasma mississippiense (nom. inval.)]